MPSTRNFLPVKSSLEEFHFNASLVEVFFSFHSCEKEESFLHSRKREARKQKRFQRFSAQSSKGAYHSCCYFALFRIVLARALLIIMHKQKTCNSHS